MSREPDNDNRRWFIWWLLLTSIASLLDNSTAVGSAASFVRGFRDGLVAVAMAVTIFALVNERRRVGP